MYEKIAEILAPLGYDYFISRTGIAGPVNTIVVFASQGDFVVACIDSDDRIVWHRSAAETKS